MKKNCILYAAFFLTAICGNRVCLALVEEVRRTYKGIGLLAWAPDFVYFVAALLLLARSHGSRRLPRTKRIAVAACGMLCSLLFLVIGKHTVFAVGVELDSLFAFAVAADLTDLISSVISKEKA